MMNGNGVRGAIKVYYQRTLTKIRELSQNNVTSLESIQHYSQEPIKV